MKSSDNPAKFSFFDMERYVNLSDVSSFCRNHPELKGESLIVKLEELSTPLIGEFCLDDVKSYLIERYHNLLGTSEDNDFMEIMELASRDLDCEIGMNWDSLDRAFHKWLDSKDKSLE